MNRGEVWWVTLGPSIGEEIKKTRPAIVVSVDAANRALDRLQVVPLTSRIAHVFPGEALVTLNGSIRKAKADQITTISKARVGQKLGVISPDDMEKVEGAILRQLGIFYA